MGVPIRAELILSTKESGGGGAGKVLASDKTSTVMEKYVKPVMSLLLMKLVGGTLFKGLLTGLSGILGGLLKGVGGAVATTGGVAGKAIGGTGIGKGIWEGFKNAMKTGWKALAWAGGLIWLGLKTALKGAGRLLMGLGSLIWAGVKTAASFVGGGLAKAGTMMGTALTSVLGAFASVTLPALIAGKIVQSNWFNKLMGYDRLSSDYEPTFTEEQMNRGKPTVSDDDKANGWSVMPNTLEETSKEKKKVNELMSSGLPLLIQENSELKLMYMTLLPMIGAKNAEAVARKMSTEAITKENNAYKEQVSLLSQLRADNKSKNYKSVTAPSERGTTTSDLYGKQTYSTRFGQTHPSRQKYNEAGSVSGYSKKFLGAGVAYGNKVPDAVG